MRDALETNVICYSTPESSDLEGSSHTGGAARGREIFRTLFKIIEPKVMIVFGSGTVGELEKVIGHHVPKPPTKLPSKPVETRVGQTSVFAIPSLSPRVVNRLGPSLVKEHYEGVCRVVATRLR